MSLLRVVLPDVPEPGELVVSRDAGGARHFLDGKPVTCGSYVVYLREGVGELVRYESAGPITASSAVIYFAFAPAVDERTVRRSVHRGDRFRWPTKDEVRTGRVPA